MKKLVISLAVVVSLVIVVSVGLFIHAFMTISPEPRMTQEIGQVELEAERMAVEESNSPPLIAPSTPIQLTVFVYDSCGGCGMGDMGCGSCDVKDALHLRILTQFGGLERLHDGSFTYRLLNIRLMHNEDLRRERTERYGVPEGLRGILPMIFIGTEYEGLYLIGDDLVPFVQQKLDRYLAGEDRKEIQRDIMSLMNIPGGAPCCV